jgi:DNA-directed RNA polymerase specialized sigma24 family protein
MTTDPRPPDFEAFLALHRERYLAYARVHLPSAAAEEEVTAVFEHLLSLWQRVLRCPNPASYAWYLLTSRVRLRCPGPSAAGAAPGGDGARRPARTPAEHDAHTLHHVLGYPLREVAAVMGEDPGTVRYLLREPRR